MPSYLTDAERTRLAFELDDFSGTLGYADVSHSHLSIARHYGGATVQGHRYTYCAESDELWRDDVLRLVRKWREEAAKPDHFPDAGNMVQASLLGGE